MIWTAEERTRIATATPDTSQWHFGKIALAAHVMSVALELAGITPSSSSSDDEDGKVQKMELLIEIMTTNPQLTVDTFREAPDVAESVGIFMGTADSALTERFDRALLDRAGGWTTGIHKYIGLAVLASSNDQRDHNESGPMTLG